MTEGQFSVPHLSTHCKSSSLNERATPRTVPRVRVQSHSAKAVSVELSSRAPLRAKIAAGRCCSTILNGRSRCVPTSNATPISGIHSPDALPGRIAPLASASHRCSRLYEDERRVRATFPPNGSKQRLCMSGMWKSGSMTANASCRSLDSAETALSHWTRVSAGIK